jgi:6-phosphogluconolactonase (cycloisomerase 2 family)
VYNLAADEVKQELFVTVEFQPEVLVYRKGAAGEERPLRTLVGENTGLDAPHGIAVDEKDRLMFVNTWGHHAAFKLGGTGKYFPPAIKVYALDANGDVPPLRVITGDKTQLDWPGAMKYNPDNGDLYIANDIGESVLVFAKAASAQGDVAPVRVIKGPSTRLRNPTGVALDLKNKEVWVSNLGNSSATVYPLTADGDVAPLRVIRSAEESKRGLLFGRTPAVTYDPNRQEIIVPNCVNHPQIAIFARSATQNTPFLRSIEGQKSLLGRTMHDIAFDAIHDEIVVTSPLAQGILSFRGAANGEEAPLRIIQGDKTQIRAQVRKPTGPNVYEGAGATAKLTVDPVHNEILLASPDQDILVFDRLANGNVAPKRVLGGKDTQLMLGDQTPIRVDPIHNLLIVPSGGFGGGKILVFDRTASGNTPPRASIKGPVRMGEQFEIYAPKLRLITHAGNNIEIWKIPESGESDEQPVKISAPLGRQSADIGIVLDPLHKEVIIATAAGNAIMTFFVPEVFDDLPAGSQVTSASK